MGIIKISTFFQLGGGRQIVEPILRSSAYRRMYWVLIGCGIAFWVLLIWFSFWFPGTYAE
jgi:hypothetical protein